MLERQPLVRQPGYPLALYRNRLQRFWVGVRPIDAQR
jgi:hypothetical protein